MIWIVAYLLIAALAVFALVVSSEKLHIRRSKYDDPSWPVICGCFWPVAGPIAAAYIAARWYLDNREEISK